MVEQYSLRVHSLPEHTDHTMMMDNEACSVLTTGNSVIELNHWLARVISSLRASLRYGRALNVDVTECQTHVASHPRIHSLLCNYALSSRWRRSTWHSVCGSDHHVCHSCFLDGQARFPPRKGHGVLTHVPISCNTRVSSITHETYNVPTEITHQTLNVLAMSYAFRSSFVWIGLVYSHRVCGEDLH